MSNTVELEEGFTEALMRTKSGRLLHDHSKNYIAKYSVKENNSAQLQVTTLRRTLMHALRKSCKEMPFGLPRKLPRFLLLANFSGEMAILYADTELLMKRVLSSCGNPLDTKARLDALQTFISFEDYHPKLEVVVLCTLVQPWAEGIESGFFEMRTITRNKQGEYMDGQRVFTSLMEYASLGSNTEEPCLNDQSILNVTIDDWEKIDSLATATSVDLNLDTTSADTAPTTSSDQRSWQDAHKMDTKLEQVLRNTISTMRLDAKRLTDEMADAKSKLQQDLQNAVDAAKAQERVTQKQALNALRVKEEKINDVTKQLLECRNACFKEEKRVKDLQRIIATKDIEHKAEIESNRFKLDASNQTYATISKRCSSLEKANDELRSKVTNVSTKNEKLTEANTKLERESTSIKKKYDSINVSSTKKIQELQSSLESTQNKVCYKQSMLQQLERSAAAERESNENAKKEMDKLKSIKIELKTQLFTLCNELKESESKYKTYFTDTWHLHTTKSIANTQTTGTDTMIDVLSTSKESQTDFDSSYTPEVRCRAEASKQAFSALLKLCELTQTPHSDYTPQFRGHARPPSFRPPGPR
mgnify:CR=1 FL=1|tara:strand:+ start:514 stop:2277 length:1764 start_codon:yes stop_codon:yes gene_type:complete